MAGVITKQPDVWMITQDQGEQLTDALIDVAKQYEMTFNPKLISWVNLIGVGAAVYTPKILLMKVKRANVQQAQQAARRENAPQPGAVIQFPEDMNPTH